jgi:hypothetical protein
LEDSERASVRHWQRCKIRLDHINQVADCARVPAMRPPQLTRSVSAVVPPTSSSTATTAAAVPSSTSAATAPPLLQRSESTPLPSVRESKDDKSETKTPLAAAAATTPATAVAPATSGDDSDDDEMMMLSSLPWLPPDEVEQKRLSRLFIDHLLRNGASSLLHSFNYYASHSYCYK